MSCCHGSKISGGSEKTMVLQMAEKNEKINVYDFPVHYCTQEQNSTPYFSSMV